MTEADSPCSGTVHGGLHYNCPMKRLLVLSAVLLLAPAPWVQAEPGRADVEDRVPSRTLAESLSLDEAVALMEKQYDARVVRAEEKDEKGRRVYRIRLLSADGRVFDVKVDAATGQVE